MKKLTIFLFLLLSVGYSSVALYSLINSDIEDVTICSTDDNTRYIPSDVCEYYLLNYRADKGDIESLESGAGLAFLFEIKDSPKETSEYFNKGQKRGPFLNTGMMKNGLVHTVRTFCIEMKKKTTLGDIIVNEKALYNVNTTIDFELHSSEEESLVSRILILAGTAIKQPDIQQAGAQDMQLINQQQNS